MKFLKCIAMNKYLKDVKTLVKDLKKRPVLVVIGNESVDLDSAVSAICLAYHLHRVKTSSHVISVARQSDQLVVIPAINATRVDLPIKTEVTHWLKKNQIDIENLICRDDIILEQDVESFVLVDHHVSVFREKVISVMDHRPFDEISNLNSDCIRNIQEVGSCATLVCEAIKKDVSLAELSENYIEVLRLCYGPIVLDTINFSREADKVRALDIEIGEFIERALSVQDVAVERKNLYDELVAARADVSSLNSLQILSKDLKIISNENGHVKVAIPGVDVFNYIKMDKAEENVRFFAEREGVDVVVLMGMRPKGDSIERFIGVINIKNESLFNDVLEAVSSMKTPDLLLEQREADFMGGRFFEQKNIKASRKQILPVIKSVLNRSLKNSE